MTVTVDPWRAGGFGISLSDYFKPLGVPGSSGTLLFYRR
jgi:hypothetical protein